MAYGSLQKRRLEGLAAIQTAPAEAAQLAAYKAQLLQEGSDALLDAGKKASPTPHSPAFCVWSYMNTTCQGLLTLLIWLPTSRPASCQQFHVQN